MKLKALVIIMHLIILITATMSIWSFYCFATYEKTTGTVTACEAYPDDTVVGLTYVAGNTSYVRTQSYSGTSQIRYGDQRPVWYNPDHPEYNVMVRDFAAYYILTGIMGVGELAYFLGRNQRKIRESEIQK